MTQMTEYQKQWESLGISNDFLFGKVMMDAELCKELLQIILPGIEIDHIEYTQLQKAIKPDADAKSVRLDVYVKDGKGSIYDIEMQTTDTGELPKRSRYYQSIMDLQMIDRGESYRKLNKSYVIFICLEDVFGEGRHKYTFENICIEDKTICLKDGTEKIFLNANGTMDDVSKELKVFLDYVAGKELKEASEFKEHSFIKRLEEAVAKAKKNREWRYEYMTLLMRDQENVEKGIEQGRKQGLEQVAVQLLDVLDVETIAQKTGLSVERIMELKKNNI